MKVVIIEDENPAAKKLIRYLSKYKPETSVVKQLASVKESVSWFLETDESFDIVFMDIQLEDGLSFEIFNKVKIQKPIIFTTAYDEYAIDAFKVNSIDYLLKPIIYSDLARALEKIKLMKQQLSEQDSMNLNASIANLKEKKYKDRFLVKMGNYIRSIKTDEISHFWAEGRTVFLQTIESKKYIVDYKLQELEDLLDAQKFFRISRSVIIHIEDISSVAVYSSARLNVLINNKSDKELVVSRERVSEFKEWLDR